MSRILSMDVEHRDASIAQAVDVVRGGGLVVLPTDTVYGVGCDAFDAVAVAALLTAKGRGREMPPPVLVGSTRAVDALAQAIPDYVRRLVDRYWPGPLTLVVRAQPSVRWDLGETNGTVALRMPDDEGALALVQAVGPMAVTSANTTGAAAATTVADAAAMLGPSVSLYLDGGPSRGGLASTIVDCTGESPQVLREGALAFADLLAFLDA